MSVEWIVNGAVATLGGKHSVWLSEATVEYVITHQ